MVIQFHTHVIGRLRNVFNTILLPMLWVLVSSFISVEDQALRHQIQPGNLHWCFILLAITGAALYKVCIPGSSIPCQSWDLSLPTRHPAEHHGILRAQVPQRKPSSSRAKRKLQYALEHLHKHPVPTCLWLQLLSWARICTCSLSLETIMVAMMQLGISTVIQQIINGLLRSHETRFATYPKLTAL
ncbi:hypothetical protein BGX38DRAFT_576572 [Terfezia claveryi]|nr:hypothetical protein BGX38DRAFT_576572 [Terfezia claveryi]